MALYSVYLPRAWDGTRASLVDQARLVPDGFSFWGFLFPLLWLLWHRVWLSFLLILALDLALAAAREHPDRFAVMGRIAPQVLSKSKGALIGWRKQPGMLGLRLAMNVAKAPEILGSGKLDWLWAEAEAEGVALMMLMCMEHVHLVDAIAAKHPQLKIIMDHFALDGHKRDAEAFAHFDQLLAIARRPNVAAKASALPCYTNDVYPFRALHPYIRRAYDAFGPKRLFWGTDLSRSPIPYRQQVTMFTEEIPWLNAQDKEWIMGRALCEWLGWNQ